MIEGLFSPVHILVILVVALVVLGPGKMPDVGQQVGKAIREYRRFQHLVNNPVRSLAEGLVTPPPPPASPVAPAADPPPATGPDPSRPPGGTPSPAGSFPPDIPAPHDDDRR